MRKFYCLMARNETEQVRQLQRTLYRTAKQSKALKFYSLYDKVWRTDVLWEAWKQVKANRGAPGVDSETIEGIESRGEEEEMLSRLQQQLRTKSYRFQPVRRVDIPKPKGGTRPLGIATVRDRIVQTAMKLVLEPIFEADFPGDSPMVNAEENGLSDVIRKLFWKGFDILGSACNALDSLLFAWWADKIAARWNEARFKKEIAQALPFLFAEFGGRFVSSPTISASAKFDFACVTTTLLALVVLKELLQRSKPIFQQASYVAQRGI